MKKRTRERALSALLALIALVAVAGYLHHHYRQVFGPGSTIDETAHILVHDS